MFGPHMYIWGQLFKTFTETVHYEKNCTWMSKIMFPQTGSSSEFVLPLWNHAAGRQIRP